MVPPESDRPMPRLTWCVYDETGPRNATTDVLAMPFPEE